MGMTLEEVTNPKESKNLEGREMENRILFGKLLNENNIQKEKYNKKSMSGKRREKSMKISSSKVIREEVDMIIPEEIFEKYALLTVGDPKFAMSAMQKDIPLDNLEQRRITKVDYYEDGFLVGFQMSYNNQEYPKKVSTRSLQPILRSLSLKENEELEGISVIYKLKCIQHLIFYTTEDMP